MTSPIQIPAEAPVSACSMHGALDRQAALQPRATALRFLPDAEDAETVVNYAELAEKSRAIAAGMMEHGITGKPVLVIEPTGPEFVASLFACWYAGAIAVPAYPPRGSRHRARLAAIFADSGARHALEGSASVPPAAGMDITILNPAALASSAPLESIPKETSTTCLLQYTSGSTADPKGVMMSHRNFRNHLDATRQHIAPLAIRSILSWLPPYHDMGLVLKILHAIDSGIPLTFFSADHFLQRPARWLRAISKYRTELSGAPDFAFDLCVRNIRDEELEGIDLSCWKAAPCGAERVRESTLEKFARRFADHGFRKEAFLPGYGLAEATLSVTASPVGKIPRVSKTGHVSCGKALQGVTLRIADPETGATLPDGETGEVRVKGDAVALGYWRKEKLTRSQFGATSERELLTGDLGFLENGHLHITGRIKDLVILDGVNHSPDDIETALLRAIPEITTAAAFSEEADDSEKLAFAIEARDLPKNRRAAICREASAAISEALEIPVHRVVLVKTGLLPRTTSGKIRRSACRGALASGAIRPLHEEPSTANSTAVLSVDALLEIIAIITRRGPVSSEDHALAIGISSLEATRIIAKIRSEFGVNLSMPDFFSAPSFKKLASEWNYDVSRRSSLPETATDVLPMTHSQERMWFLHQLDPSSAAYHVFGSLDLTGALDFSALENAFHHVVSRHEILRSRHGISHGKPEVWIDAKNLPGIGQQHLGGEEALEKSLTAFAREPFDLARKPPARARIFSIGDERHTLAICIHHIAADGFSMRIIARELAEAYAAFQCGKQPDFSEKNRFLDYAARHRHWIENGAVDHQIDYWKSRLSGHSGMMNLPTDFPRPPRPSSDGGFVEKAVPSHLTKRIAAFAALHKATPFMVHLTAFFLLLRQHGAGDDSVIAIPVANRNHADADALVGTLVNTLPFRLTIQPEKSFTELLLETRDAAFEMQAAQDAPFERIIDAIRPERSMDHSPLAQVMFDYQEIPLEEIRLDSLKTELRLAHRGASQFDLALLISSIGGDFRIGMEFRKDLFLEETIAAMLDRYLATLETALAGPEQAVSGIHPLTDEDRNWLRRHSQGPSRPDFTSISTPAWIALRAVKHPQRQAVQAPDGSLDYAELEHRSDRLASHLQHAGIRSGDRVAVMLERGVQLPVALLAIWKTGAAYVPLDRANPKERLALILADQAPLKILISPGMEAFLPENAEEIFLSEAMLESGPAFTRTPVPASAAAYILYTSGSTGVPKGVVISHGALANFLRSMAETPGFTEADRLLAVTTISFDISLLELFLPLVCGGMLDLVSSAMARDGIALAAHLRATRPTVMQATPSTWRMLIDAGWKGSPDLKILCGGEAIDAPLAAHLGTMGCELWNLYGPTETTVWSTLWRIPQNPAHIRIGTPIANTGIRIANGDGGPAPPGVAGELWISGDGLAKGYWQLKELTERRFVNTPSGRFYRTGDLARWHRDGTLECLGRSDGQVKIRGFRVELGEIENALVSHPDVPQAKVVLRGKDSGSEKLVAWITSESPPDDLTEFLTERLPPYMIPSVIGVVDSFPLNASGKVDVSKLPDPQPAIAPRSEAPMSDTEKQLAAIWSGLLDGRPAHRGDDWFMSGGHSLMALRLFSAIHREFGVILPLSDILEHPRLHQLASRIEQAGT